MIRPNAGTLAPAPPRLSSSDGSEGQVAKERDEKRERQRRLFLRYFDEFEAADLDPGAVMKLAFSINSGVFLRRAIAGMVLFRDRCRPPIEFFWALENAPPQMRDLIFGLVNWDDPAGHAAKIAGIARDERKRAKKFRRAQESQPIKTVYELATALPGIVFKFEADGETPQSLFGIPGKTIAVVLSAYAKKRRKPGRRPFREMAVAILKEHEGSDEDPADVLSALVVARKERRRARRNRKKRGGQVFGPT